MKTFAEWFNENFEEDLSKETINGQWFSDHGFPMLVHCTCCGITMILPSAYIDDKDYIYCSSCKGDD